MLKVGELARRTGLTVRTLHHYDEIGLLKPSARSEAGYRLYDRSDILRLHRIQGLQRLGLSLAEIGPVLAKGRADLADIIDRQIVALDRQAAQAARLRNQLSRLRLQLSKGEEPDLAEWLTSLEMMSMFDKYFTPDEVRFLEERKVIESGGRGEVAYDAIWLELIAGFQDLIKRGVPEESSEARMLAERWTDMVEGLTGGKAGLKVKLQKMYQNEPGMQAQTGLDERLMAYIARASLLAHLDIYARYLDDAEMDHLRRHYGRNALSWASLVGEVQEAMAAGLKADSPVARAFAKRWDDLFTQSMGRDPKTRAKIRLAMEREPGLHRINLVDPAVVDFIRQVQAASGMSSSA